MRLRPPPTRARPRPDVAPARFRSSETMKKISAEENFDGSVGRTSHQICHAQLSLHSRQKVGRFESNVSRISTPPTPARTDARTLSKMGVDIETLKPGDGVTFPKPGQVVTAHYTGAHRDASREKVKPAHGGMSAY